MARSRSSRSTARRRSSRGSAKTIEEKIVQIVEKGEIEALTKRRERIPPDVVAFMRLPGLGPKTARRIWLELGVTTLDDLREAAEQQRLRTLTGLGPKIEENVLKALKERAKPKTPSRPLLGQGLPAVLAAVEALRAHPAAEQVSEAGSVRRRRETVPRPRHHRHRDRRAGADRAPSPASTGSPRSPPRAGRRRR